MTPIRLTVTTLAVAAVGMVASTMAQAGEVTDFPLSSTSNTSRAVVKAEARQANDAGLLRYDFHGAREVAPPTSTKSRDQVRMEARAAARSSDRTLAGSYYTGGM